jgi:hypothetical protein
MDFVKVWSFLSSVVPWSEVAATFRSLLSQNRRFTLLSIALLFCGFFLLDAYFVRTARYEDIVVATLKADLEETPQQYKGLEAFIMSSLNEEESPTWYERLRESLLVKPTVNDTNTNFSADLEINRNQLSSAAFDPQFLEAFANFQTAIDTFVASHSTKSQRDGDAPRLRISEGTGTNLMLTDDPPGFLFLPLSLVRGTYSDEDYKTLNDLDTAPKLALAEAKIKSDQFLLTDIEMVHSLKDTLSGFLGNSVFLNQGFTGITSRMTDPVVQAYLVTKNGVLKIVSNRPGDIEEFYKNQFRPSMFFPGRSYFEYAFKTDPTGRSNVSNPTAFYVTAPYLDLGGNGIVVTVSKSIRHSGITDSVLCLDIPVYTSSGISQALRRKFEALGGIVTDVSCDEVSASRYFQCRQSPELQSYIQHNNDRLPEINGNIEFISTKNQKNDDLLISVPVGNVVAKPPGVTVDFLLADLNLPAYRRLTDVLGAVGVTFVGLVFLLLLLGIIFFIRQRRVVEAAFTQVAEIMKRADTPYTKLSSTDRITDVNIAFCKLLGLPEEDSSIQYIKGQTFRDLIDQDDQKSLDKYTDVEKQRKAGERVDSYVLHLKLPNNKQAKSVKVRVYAGVVPTTQNSPNEFPETFGVAIQLSS